MELTNVYDNPSYATTVAELKARLAAKRKSIGDNGQESAAVEQVIQEFWDFDQRDREEALAISQEYLQSRQGIRRYIPGENKHDK